ADVFALRIQPGESVIELARSVISSDSFQNLRRLGKMFAQRLGQSASAPQEHAAVPEVISGSKKACGALGIRLFCKPPYAQRLAIVAVRSFDVAIPRLWACRPDPDDHNIWPACGCFDPLPQDLAETVFIADHMIGRKHAEYCISIHALQYEGG